LAEQTGVFVVRKLATIAAIILAGYSAIIGVMYFLQEGMVYHPDRQVSSTPSAAGLVFEDVSFTTRDGATIAAWYIPASNATGTILFCHGNAGNISHRLQSIEIFHNLRLNVLIFDYRGYGNSDGKPSEEGTYLDAEAAWDYLTKVRGVPPESIILFGRSLGGAVAAETALRKDPGALILESAFTSAPDLGRSLYPWLPVGLIARIRYATIDKVGSIRCPKLIVHSPDDDVVPFDHATRLFDAASSPKTFLQIEGGHNDGFLASGAAYRDGLRRFVESVLGGTPGPQTMGFLGRPLVFAPLLRSTPEGE
jgi:fermentation-respiration switch protein FrsA (DUF1100 family)